MALIFRNATNSRLYLTVAYPNSGCSPVAYAKLGWYHVEPGQTRRPIGANVGGFTFYFYAEDVFGRRWNGPYFTQVPNTPFHWCWNLGCSTCRNLGFRRIDVPANFVDYTITLTMSPSQGNSKSGKIVTVLPSKLKKVKPLFIKPKALPSKLIKLKPLLSNRIALPSPIDRSRF